MPRGVLAGLIALSAILFAIGALVERSVVVHREGPPTVQSPMPESGAETGNEGNAGNVEPVGTGAEPSSGESLFGINLESTAAIAGAVLISMVLTALVWRLSGPTPLWLALGFGLLAAALDVREVIHQLNESRSGLALVAVAVGLVHLAVAGFAATLMAMTRREKALTD